MARILQNLESSLTVRGLLPLCEEAGLFNFAMHDGGFCRAQDVDHILKLFKTVCLRELGFELTVKIKEIVQPEVTSSKETQNASPTPYPPLHMCVHSSPTAGTPAPDVAIFDHFGVFTDAPTVSEPILSPQERRRAGFRKYCRYQAFKFHRECRAVEASVWSGAGNASEVL
jgi:hypothetical protein